MKTLKSLALKPKREAYVRAHVQHGLAHQIRMLREHRGWTQAELAQKIGARNQSTVARLEDPSYGKYSVSSLVRLANAFDVGALVKFVSFSKLLVETADLSPNALRVLSYEEEGAERHATTKSVGIPPYDSFIHLDMNTNDSTHSYIPNPQSSITLYASESKENSYVLG